MIIRVKVKPNSKEEKIEKIRPGEYAVCLKEPARKGKANKELLGLLSKKFNISWRDIKIKNLEGRNKIVELRGVNEI